MMFVVMDSDKNVYGSAWDDVVWAVSTRNMLNKRYPTLGYQVYELKLVTRDDFVRVDEA